MFIGTFTLLCVIVARSVCLIFWLFATYSSTYPFVAKWEAATKQYVDSRAIKKLADTSLPTSGTTTILSQEEADKYTLYLGYINSSSSDFEVYAIDASNKNVYLIENGSNYAHNAAFMMLNDVSNNISTVIYYRFYSSYANESTKYLNSYGAKFSGKIKTVSATSAKIVLYGFTS